VPNFNLLSNYTPQSGEIEVNVGDKGYVFKQSKTMFIKLMAKSYFKNLTVVGLVK
jgi:hypothetical protein